MYIHCSIHLCNLCWCTGEHKWNHLLQKFFYRICSNPIPPDNATHCTILARCGRTYNGKYLLSRVHQSSIAAAVQQGAVELKRHHIYPNDVVYCHMGQSSWLQLSWGDSDTTVTLLSCLFSPLITCLAPPSPVSRQTSTQCRTLCMWTIHTHCICLLAGWEYLPGGTGNWWADILCHFFIRRHPVGQWGRDWVQWWRFLRTESFYGALVSGQCNNRYGVPVQHQHPGSVPVSCQHLGPCQQ